MEDAASFPWVGHSIKVETGGAGGWIPCVLVMTLTDMWIGGRGGGTGGGCTCFV